MKKEIKDKLSKRVKTIESKIVQLDHEMSVTEVLIQQSNLLRKNYQAEMDRFQEMYDNETMVIESALKTKNDLLNDSLDHRGRLKELTKTFSEIFD